MKSIEKLHKIMKNNKNNAKGGYVVATEGVIFAKVITENPYTIQLSGSTISLPLDYFVFPDNMHFIKGETLLAYKIQGTSSMHKQYILVPFSGEAIISVYNGGSYSLENGVSINEADVFCPWPIIPGTNVYIQRKRFLNGKLWAVVNTWI